MLRTLLIVALGGGVGSALRYAVSKFVQDNMSGAFPYHTFAVNIVGCLLIGLFYGLAARGHLGNNATTLLLTTGLCHVLQREHRTLAWRQRFRRPTLHRQ